MPSWVALFRKFTNVAALTAFAALSSGCATPGGILDAASSSAQPWVRAQSVADAAGQALERGGIRAIGSHVADLERELSGAKQAIEAAGASDVVLTDGSTETLGALLIASAEKQKNGQQGSVAAVPNPYRAISFFLGAYYNEMGKQAEALRVLDAGLTLPGPLAAGPLADSDLGEFVPPILSERGVALAALDRWQDSLDNFDRALKIKFLMDPARARMLRGRGVALIELKRLDDAEAAFNESLKLERNERALGEIRYIENLRKGGAEAPFVQTTGSSAPQ